MNILQKYTREIFKEIWSTSGVYLIENKVDSKRYIGESAEIGKRLKTHIGKLLNNTHENTHLQNAVNKYGINEFLFDVIEICEPWETKRREHHWCTILYVHYDEYGYNMRPTNPDGRVIVTEDIRKKISKGNKGKKLSEETKNKISNSLKGRVFTESHKKKLGRPGIKKSKEAIEKRLQSKNVKAAIVILDSFGNKIKEFESIKECAEYYKVSAPTIGGIVRKKCGTKCYKRNIILYKKDYDIGNYKLPEIKNRIKVIIYKEEVMVGVYCSITEAANKINMAVSQVHRIYKNNREYKGYRVKKWEENK